MNTVEMNVLGLSILQDIRQVSFFKHSIIAGGFVRDLILGGKFNDIDIYVPYTDPSDILPSLYQLVEKNLGFEEPYFKGNKKYKMTSETHVFATKYMDIPVDIIGIKYPDTIEGFGEHVINTFSYGIDMAYYDYEVKCNKHFNHDQKNCVATLLKLNSITDLPNAINKFTRLVNKYPGKNILFNCPLLQLKNSQDEISAKLQDETNVKSYYVKDWLR